jgi:squalene-associated FAD-dependent desaturase
MSKVHIIGAGLAGLSAAVDLTAAGRPVALYEAADQAGGRCRSYEDAKLGRRIDNGNHLLLSANEATLVYLKQIGSRDSLIEPREARFPFLDLESGHRWALRPGRGPFPFWLFDKDRRIPDTRFLDYLGAWRLAVAGPNATVTDCIRPEDRLWRRFWEPLVLAVLNTPPEKASAALLWRVVKETFLKGDDACRPLIARDCLAASLVDPALAFLEGHGAQFQSNRRVRSLQFESGRLDAIEFGDETLSLTPGDSAILAVAPAAAAQLLPSLEVPEKASPIVNAHFLLPRLSKGTPGTETDLPILGLVGGLSQWIFLRGSVASITVSAADDLVAEPNDRVAAALWRETATALGLGDTPLPAHRIIKEKRATFTQTPAAMTRRAPTMTRWPNLFLAGDWTDTGLPATIESAVRSGRSAAACISGKNG